MKISHSRAPLHAALGVAALLLLPAAVSASEHVADAAQIARGAKAWSANCNRCHNVRGPDELQDYEWDVSVMHMRKVGNIPGEVARDIAAFLKSSN